MGIFGNILNSMEQSMIESVLWPLYDNSLRGRVEDNFKFAQNGENNWKRTVYFMAAINRGLSTYDSDVQEFYRRHKSMIIRCVGKLQMNKKFQIHIRTFMDKIKKIENSDF